MRSKLTALFWVRDSYLPTIKAPPLYKAVLLLGASYANPDGSRIFQSSRGVATLLGCERSTVQDAFKFWREQGVLVLVQPGNGRNHANEYRLNLERECVSPRLEANGVRETPFEHVNGVGETPFSEGNGVTGTNKRGDKRSAGNPPPKSPNKSTEKKETLAALAYVEKRRTHVVEEFSEEVYRTLLAFEEHRKKLRAPMTERAFELILKKLARFRAEGMDPIEVLEQSIMNGWVGIFPVRRERASEPKSFHERRSEQSAQAIDKVLGRFAEASGSVQRALPPARK
jgi:biotin operon repressor